MGRGQAGIEHGHHAPVGCRADQPAGALGQQGGGPGEVDQAEGGRGRGVPAGPAGGGRRDGGTGSGRWSPVTAPARARRRPARSPWWRTGRSARRPLKRATSAGLGRSDWVSTLQGSRGRRAVAAASMARQLVNRARVRPPAARMSASSSVVHGRLEPGLIGDREGGRRSTGAPGGSSRTGCRRRSRRRSPPVVRADGRDRVGWWRWSAPRSGASSTGPQQLGQDGADLDGAPS